jgi:hypothetical protein
LAISEQLAQLILVEPVRPAVIPISVQPGLALTP